MRKTVIAILIYSAVYCLSVIVLWKADFNKKRSNSFFQYLYAFLVAISFITIGRIPFSFLHYFGKDGIVDSVIGVFSIVLIVFSVYFTFYFLRKIYNYKTVRAIFDCNGRRISYMFPALVLVPIFALSIFLFLYSDNFAVPKMTLLLEVALLAPFYEEIGFRAILPRIANGNTNLTTIHAIIYSVIFAVMHIGEGNGFFYYLTIFTSSLYCYFLISITRKVKYPIIFHALGNLVRLFYIS